MTYRFKCNSCGEKFEQNFLSYEQYKNSKIICPKCKSKNVVKLPPLLSKPIIKGGY